MLLILRVDPALDPSPIRTFRSHKDGVLSQFGEKYAKRQDSPFQYLSRYFDCLTPGLRSCANGDSVKEALLTQRGDHALYPLTLIAIRTYCTQNDFINSVKNMLKENLWDCFELENFKSAFEDCIRAASRADDPVATFQDHARFFGCVTPGLRQCTNEDPVKERKL
ncbi:unnamed protein product, partial [Allacma fusca]